MFPLLAASVIAVAVVIERFVYYCTLESGNAAFRTRLRSLILAGRTEEALQWLRGLKGPVPVTAIAAIETWHEGVAAAEAAMAARARLEMPKLRKFLSFLDTTYSAAPLVGLLGTITGMMGTFRVVARQLSHDPTADTSGVTVGIGEALITTATGILIAVTCLVFHNLFQSWSDIRMDAAEVVAAEVVEALEQARPHQQKKEQVDQA